jgi:hypothetical protein
LAGCLVFDFAAVFVAITFLCAARGGGYRKVRRLRAAPLSTNHGPAVSAGLIKPRLTLDQPAKTDLFRFPSALTARGPGIVPLPYAWSLGLAGPYP